jgi:hypothetical protein
MDTQHSTDFKEDSSISLRAEVSLFVLSPEIEDRDESEVANWAKTRRPSTLNSEYTGCF